jgi:hypothetical protein
MICNHMTEMFVLELANPIEGWCRKLFVNFEEFITSAYETVKTKIRY